MKENSFKISPLRIAGTIALVVCFACIRLFEGKLFYDPFIAFFKHEGKVLPQYDMPALFISLSGRYFLNSLVSLGVLWLVFKDRQVIKLSALLYVAFFVVLAAALFFVLNAQQPPHLAIFYIRRFLIQPLLLLLFLPAFYYQKHMK
jgi:exosortase F-associated protein